MLNCPTPNVILQIMPPAQWQLAGQFVRSLQLALGIPDRGVPGHREAVGNGCSRPGRFFDKALFRDGLLLYSLSVIEFILDQNHWP